MATDVMSEPGTWYLLSDGETPYLSPRPLGNRKKATKAEVEKGLKALADRPAPEPILTGEES